MKPAIGFDAGIVPNQHIEYKGCDVCNDPAVWETKFGFPFPYLNKKKKVGMTYCPVCGRQLHGSREG